jgi:hypothetical protein
MLVAFLKGGITMRIAIIAIGTFVLGFAALAGVNRYTDASASVSMAPATKTPTAAAATPTPAPPQAVAE